MAEQLRELDAAVAERVMDAPCNCDRTPDGSIWCRRHGKGEGVGAAFYSKRIEAAMQVVEKMREQDQDLEVEMHTGKDKWIVSFAADRMDGAGYQYIGEGAAATTLPEAICRAALKAVEEQNRSNSA